MASRPSLVSPFLKLLPLQDEVWKALLPFRKPFQLPPHKPGNSSAPNPACPRWTQIDLMLLLPIASCGSKSRLDSQESARVVPEVLVGGV